MFDQLVQSINARSKQAQEEERAESKRVEGYLIDGLRNASDEDLHASVSAFAVLSSFIGGALGLVADRAANTIIKEIGNFDEGIPAQALVLTTSFTAGGPVVGLTKMSTPEAPLVPISRKVLVGVPAEKRLEFLRFAESEIRRWISTEEARLVDEEGRSVQ